MGDKGVTSKRSRKGTEGKESKKMMREEERDSDKESERERESERAREREVGREENKARTSFNGRSCHAKRTGYYAPCGLLSAFNLLKQAPSRSLTQGHGGHSWGPLARPSTLGKSRTELNGVCHTPSVSKHLRKPGRKFLKGVTYKYSCTQV